MPYKVVKKYGMKPWKVVKETDGKIMGSHKSEVSARRQLRALYANEKRSPR